MSETAAERVHGARRLAAAVALFVAGALILFVRFPPADLTGWIAQTLHIPLGVPVIMVAALFGGAAWLLRTTKRYRGFRTTATVMACIVLLLGMPLIAVPV